MKKKPLHRCISGFVPPEVTGGRYAYVCLACRHRFTRSIRLGLLCPECKSLRVVCDGTIQY